MHNHKKTYWILIIVLGIMYSCNGSNETEPDSDDQQVTEPINLMDCQPEKFEILFEKLEEFLPLMDTGCKEFKVAYKPIPEEEKELMTIYMSEFVTKHLADSPESDSTLFLQEYQFTDLEFCEPTITYDSSDSCSFYTGLIYHTLDYKVQFIRLFQDGSEEYFDLYLDLTNDEPRVIGFG